MKHHPVLPRRLLATLCLVAGVAQAEPPAPTAASPQAETTDERSDMVEVVVPGLVSEEEAARVRERNTINPTTAEFKRAEESALVRDATGAVRAPVYRTLKQAHAAGINPEPVAAAPASMDTTIERPLWAMTLGWVVGVLLAGGALLALWLGLKRIRARG